MAHRTAIVASLRLIILPSSKGAQVAAPSTIAHQRKMVFDSNYHAQYGCESEACGGCLRHESDNIRTADEDNKKPTGW